MGGAINKVLDARRERNIVSYGTFRLLLFGLDGSGKTSILNYIKTRDCGHPEPTALFNVESLSLSGSLNVSVRDFGGRAEYRDQWVRGVEGGDAILYAVDSSDRERLQESKLELDKLSDKIMSLRIPTLLLANKQELPGALSLDEISLHFSKEVISREDGLSGIYSTSAVSGQGIDELVELMKRYFKKQ